jgi:hypothetical protein
VFPGVDSDLKSELFHDAPANDNVWIGDVFVLRDDQQELIPVRFGTQDFWMGFTSPKFEASHDPELLRQYSQNWAEGFVPDEFSRLIKFSRADADFKNLFKPDSWKLSLPEQIFQFGQTLGEAVVFHAQTFLSCKEYFFWPASPRLELLYKRVFRYVDRVRLPKQFVAILDDTGAFNGYQRTSSN